MTRPRVQIPAEALYFVTSNADKLREAREVLHTDLKQYTLDLEEVQSMDEQFVALSKLRAAKKHLKEPFFVEDVSLRTDALNGLPGPFIKYFVKRFSLQELVDLLRGPVQAICTIAYWDGSQEHVVQGVVPGSIVASRGEGWGFSTVFEHAELGLTFAEFSDAQRSTYTHRSVALAKLKEFLDA